MWLDCSKFLYYYLYFIIIIVQFLYFFKYYRIYIGYSLSFFFATLFIGVVFILDIDYQARRTC